MCKSGASCVRVLMIIFNSIFTIVGLIILAAALYFFIATFGLSGPVEPNILLFTYIITAIIGALSFVLGILGCCGSYHYSRCLLGFYFIILLIIFAVEVTIGIAGISQKEQIRNVIDATLKAGVEDRMNAGSEFRWMDAIQTSFQCCGYSGATDYGIKYPSSCCPNHQCGSLLTAYFNSLKGCKDRVDEIMQNFTIIFIVVFVIAVVELFGLIFALTLCCAAKGREPAYYSAVQT